MRATGRVLHSQIRNILSIPSRIRSRFTTVPPVLDSGIDRGIDRGIGARDIVQPPPGGGPTWTPAYRADFRGGTHGQIAEGAFAFESVNNNIFSSVPGLVYETGAGIPLSGGICGRVNFTELNGSEGTRYYAGKPIVAGGLNLTAGSELWVRIAMRFPAGWRWEWTGGPDGYGFSKWFQPLHNGSENNGRNFQPQQGGVTFTPGPSLTNTFGWLQADGSAEIEFSSSPISYGDGQGGINGFWRFQQAYLLVGKGGAGRVRFWADDTLMDNRVVSTLATSATAITGFQFGDYWNGGRDGSNPNHFYIDELIIATSASPPTDDTPGSPGIKYIPTTIRVSDFD